ncbi:hypothetical protein RHIZ404_200933 [Rhizobium sp. EC-SD404]|nr:hypothetical protein RHIZ404_200933 [Rhizobium sp. EC-SD404]
MPWRPVFVPLRLTNGHMEHAASHAGRWYLVTIRVWTTN